MALQPEVLVLSAVNSMGTNVPSVTFDDPVVPGSPVVVPARPRHFVEAAGFIIIFAICCIAGWAVFFANAEQRKEMEEKIAERFSEWKKQLLSCMKPNSGPTGTVRASTILWRCRGINHRRARWSETCSQQS